MSLIFDAHFWYGVAATACLLIIKMNPRCAGCRGLALELGRAQGIAKECAEQMRQADERWQKNTEYIQSILDRTLVTAGVIRIEKPAEVLKEEAAEAEEKKRLEAIAAAGGEVYGAD